MNARLIFYGLLMAVMVVAWVGAFVIYRSAESGAHLAPLEPRRFESLTVIAVGTGNEFENPTRLGPCTAIGLGDRIWLVDAGRGVAEALRSAQIPVAQPDTVLLTSLLPEATLGLDDLLFTGWRRPRERPLRLIGPPGTRAFADGLLAAYRTGAEAVRTGLDLPAEGAQLEVVEVEDGWSEEDGGLSLGAHGLPDGPTPGLAWRFETRSGRQRSVVVSGNGWAPDALVAAASGADVWVHEAVYVPTPEDAADAGVLVEPEQLERDAALHTSIVDVGDLAARAGVGHLVLTRMRPPPMFAIQITGFLSDRFDGEISVPEDGDELVP